MLDIQKRPSGNVQLLLRKADVERLVQEIKKKPSP
jgi:hypothetical protein